MPPKFSENASWRIWSEVRQGDKSKMHDGQERREKGVRSRLSLGKERSEAHDRHRLVWNPSVADLSLVVGIEPAI